MRYLAEATPSAERAAFPDLTVREREVLWLLAQGLSNQEVADRMGISLKTARNHVSNILARLQVADRTEAIARARAAGLGGEKRSGLQPPAASVASFASCYQLPVISLQFAFRN